MSIYSTSYIFVITTKSRMDEECVICINSKAASRVSLYCGHAFHITCVEPWLLQKGTCPMCRSNDSVEALIYSSNPFLTSKMYGFKPVSQFLEDGILSSGWVIYTPDEMGQVMEWLNKKHLFLHQGANTNAASTLKVYMIVEDDVFYQNDDEVGEDINIDIPLPIIFIQEPQQPPYGDFYVD